jgi:stage II sporulation protein D
VPDSHGTEPWELTVEQTELSKALGMKGQGEPVEILQRDSGGRVLEVRLFQSHLPANEFISKMGQAFGWQSLPSAHFSVERVEGMVRFKGLGRGHGVGFCQRGAGELAQDKHFTFREILRHYFPDSAVSRSP